MRKITMPTILKVPVLAVLLYLPYCTSFLRDDEKPHVHLGYNDIAYRYSILIKDEELPYKILRPGPMPYSDNASGMIWVGKSFPYEQAIEFIIKARNYYKEIKYIAFYDLHPLYFPDQKNYELYLGAQTEDAINLNLNAWKEEDFKNLQKIKSEQEFQKLIVSHYPANMKTDKKKFFGKFIFGRIFH